MVRGPRCCCGWSAGVAIINRGSRLSSSDRGSISSGPIGSVVWYDSSILLAGDHSLCISCSRHRGCRGRVAIQCRHYRRVARRTRRAPSRTKEVETYRNIDEHHVARDRRSWSAEEAQPDPGYIEIHPFSSILHPTRIEGTCSIAICVAIDRDDGYRTQCIVSQGHDDTKARFEARLKPSVAH